MSYNHIESRIRSANAVRIPNPKRLEYEKRLEDEKNVYNPTLTGFLGPILVPIGIASAVYLIGSYLYHQFIPVTELLTADECLLILNQIKKTWSVAIVESRKQEDQLLRDYPDLTEAQEDHLKDILRQTLLSDLNLTEDQICKLYNTNKHQIKKTVEYYTQILPKSQQDERLRKVNDDIIHSVQYVLPIPDLPLGWEISNVIDLLSQWYELQIKMMELTFVDLCHNNSLFHSFQSFISPTGRVITRLKLSSEQLDVLNSTYTKNIETQIQTFCHEKGITHQFLLQLQHCVSNTNELAELQAHFSDQKQKRLTILGLQVQR